MSEFLATANQIGEGMHGECTLIKIDRRSHQTYRRISLCWLEDMCFITSKPVLLNKFLANNYFDFH